jgi:hypothetical protein
MTNIPESWIGTREFWPFRMAGERSTKSRRKTDHVPIIYQGFDVSLCLDDLLTFAKTIEEFVEPFPIIWRDIPYLKTGKV